MGWKGKTPTDFGLSFLVEADQHLKNIVTDASQQVIVRSPVDTSEYRGSHKVSIGKPDNTYEKVLDTSGTVALMRGLKTVTLVKLGDVVFVQTTSPYGIALEDGHSQQAPLGIYALTFQYIANKYK